MYIYSTSKNSLHTLDEEFQIQGSIEVKGKSMKAEETDLSFPLSQHDKWHAIRYQLICAKSMVFCLHVGKFPLGEMASFWKPVNNQKHGASRDHCWKNYSILWFLPLNGAKKTSDYRELFTQLLDFSLNISKQGPLIWKGHPCALSLADYLINLELNKNMWLGN